MESDVSAWVQLTLRITIGAYFLASGLAKLAQQGHERQITISTYQAVPSWLVKPVSLLLPIGEILLAFGLLTGLGNRLVTVTLLSLLSLFSAVVLKSVLRGERRDCGCLGDLATRRTGWGTLLQNVVLIVGSSILVYFAFSASSPPPVSVWTGLRNMGSEATAVVLLSLGWIALLALWTYAEANQDAFHAFRDRLNELALEHERDAS